MFSWNKNIISLFFLLIIFSIFEQINPNKIVFPFKTEPSNPRITNYIDSFIENKIYITVDVGTPYQTINLYLTMDTNYLIISNSSLDSSYFNTKKSSSYKNTSRYSDYLTEHLYKGYFAQDSFLIRTDLNSDEKQKFDNIEFILAIDFNMFNKKAPGYFGLQLPKENKKNLYNCLKKENVISEYYWNIKYTSDLEGYFLLGEYPKEYSNDKFLRKANAKPCKEEDANICWILKFNDIKFGEIDVNRERSAEISPEIGFIIGTVEYKQKISDNFFNKLGDKCNIKDDSDTSYEYFECKENTDFSNFPNLEFFHPDFNYKFVMTKDDLFKKYGDKIYFQVIFNKVSPEGTYWKLGKPFLKKYNFGFNTDSKKIYFYYEDEVKSNDSNLVYYIIITILSLGIIGMIIFVVLNKLIKPKRKKANELKDEINSVINEDTTNQNFLGI